MRVKVVLLVTIAVLSHTIPGVLFAQDMPATATFDGHVLFDGQSVEGAEVTLNRIGYDALYGDTVTVVDHILTGPDGFFSFMHPGDSGFNANWGFIVRHPGHSISTTTANYYTNPNDIDIMLYNSASVSGTVRSVDGEVLSDTEMVVTGYEFPGIVRTTRLGFDLPDFTVRTDANGRFQVDNLPANTRVSFRVSRSGYTTGYRSVYALTGRSDNDIYLDPAGIISGRVTNGETDEPVPNAFIEARSENSHEYWGVVSTNSDGYYSFDTLVPGLYRITVSPGRENHGFCARPLESVFAPRGGVTENANIELTRGIVISGIVTDKHTGEPVADCPVRAEMPIDDRGLPEYVSRRGTPVLNPTRSFSTGSAVTDMRGRFSITALPGHVFVSKGLMDGYSGIIDEDTEQYRLIGEDNSYEEINLKLTKLTPIYGIIYLPDGSPASGVYVGYHPDFMVTDNSGHFIYNGRFLWTGKTVTLTAYDIEHRYQGELEVTVTPDTQVEIHLRNVPLKVRLGNTIDNIRERISSVFNKQNHSPQGFRQRDHLNRYFGGQVFDLDGNPLANAKVSLNQLPSRRYAQAFTDPLGRFIIPLLTDETVQVTVTCDGYRALTREYMTNRDDVRIVLERIP